MHEMILMTAVADKSNHRQTDFPDRSAFQPFYAEPGAATSPVLFVCDHASNACPPEHPDMGLADPAMMQQHIAWDIGAAAVTERLAAQYQATAIYAGFTRLYIDPNRDLADPSLIPVASDGIAIPPNDQVSDADREDRLNTLFRPYHDEVARQIDRSLRADTVPLITAIHSFTPHMNGFDRPWHLGVLWARDPRVKDKALSWLAGLDGVVSGENEPYSAISGPGYSMDAHALARGLPHLLLEIRQDLITDKEGQDHWADIARRLIDHLIADPDIMRICRY